MGVEIGVEDREHCEIGKKVLRTVEMYREA